MALTLALAEQILSGDRRALAKAITLVESTRADHGDQAVTLLEALMPHTGQSIRLGVSGAPGVGKSTFIESLGNYLTEQGHQVAVLAVDPTSAVSGGSILGDKTRMETLSVNPKAFVRPSPAGKHWVVLPAVQGSLCCCVRRQVTMSSLLRPWVWDSPKQQSLI